MQLIKIFQMAPKSKTSLVNDPRLQQFMTECNFRNVECFVFIKEKNETNNNKSHILGHISMSRFKTIAESLPSSKPMARNFLELPPMPDGIQSFDQLCHKKNRKKLRRHALDLKIHYLPGRPGLG